MSTQNPSSAVIVLLGTLCFITGCAGNPAQMSAGCSEELAYKNSPLSQVIADLNRCFGAAIYIGDQAAKDRLLSGRLIEEEFDIQNFTDDVAMLFPSLLVTTDGTHFYIRTRVPSDGPGIN